ncbi:MAG: HupE/UreJ family protein [Candidatus Binatia bacterium]|nr:HupE/UreJ family protein [Candidatus Binatia bacterium]
MNGRTGGSRSAQLPWLTAALVLAVATVARAHDRTHSYSTWRFNGTHVEVTFRMAELDATHFSWGVYPSASRDREFAAYAVSQLRLFVDDAPCAVVSPPRVLHPGGGRLAAQWGLACPHGTRVRVRSDVLFDVVPTHLHFARVEGFPISPPERVLTSTQREWLLLSAAGGKGAVPGGFATYLWLGIEHIASGYDHLVFVLALILVGGSLSALAKVITSFTLAHSVTLALSALGWVRPEASAVEALIGFSIVMVAVENFWLRAKGQWAGPWGLVAALVAVALAAFAGAGKVPPVVAAGLALFSAAFFAWARDVQHSESLRWSVAFLFGLVHGFGFASVLLDVGLPPTALALSLGGFNVGVELGQLAVVATAWPVLQWLRRCHPRAGGWLVDGGSGVVLAAGTYWFLSRAYA